jgi:ABC-type multidrug transport system fused ATPase/permease subunit
MMMEIFDIFNVKFGVFLGIVAGIQSKLTTDEQGSYAKAGNVAEEALTNVRTVAAFSGCDKEIERYVEGLTVANAAAKKRGFFGAFGVGLMWCIIYMAYALAFWYGTKLILEGRKDTCAGRDPEYDAETLIIVLELK